MRPLPPLPTLPALAFEREDASLLEGEIVVRPAPAASAISLFFPSPFEPFLVVEGRRVTEHATARERALLTWLGRSLPQLYRALEGQRALFGTIDASGTTVVDIAGLEDGVFLDHGAVRRALGGGAVACAPFAILGLIPSKAELMSRLRGMYATGARVEVRREEGGRVLGRRVVQVGR